jgi:hypothetical protein
MYRGRILGSVLSLLLATTLATPTIWAKQY